MNLRRVGVFLRYMYPLIFILLFFEEGQFIVNAIFPDTPYWFEPYLYAADHELFGNYPAIVFLPWLSWPLNELMHFFYFSYFVVLIGGPLLGRLPPRGADRKPGFAEPGFESALTSMTMGFLCAYVWYPWLAARGPFENAELMGMLPVFEGGPFTYLARWITDGAHVTGNCFPSAHVAGTWGVTFGLLPYNRRMGILLVLLATGVSVSCVYTRYHHGVDVPAGFLMGLLGASLYRWGQA
jgi:membrane-associated phospholipid phosphatase